MKQATDTRGRKLDADQSYALNSYCRKSVEQKAGKGQCYGFLLQGKHSNREGKGGGVMQVEQVYQDSQLLDCPCGNQYQKWINSIYRSIKLFSPQKGDFKRNINPHKSRAIAASHRSLFFTKKESGGIFISHL